MYTHMYIILTSAIDDGNISSSILQCNIESRTIKGPVNKEIFRPLNGYITSDTHLYAHRFKYIDSSKVEI